jgi:cytochrome c oxidase assembly protein subunit 15
MSDRFQQQALKTPRWLHGWALLTVAATLVLLALGAIVTTFQVGMSDPIWPTYPWHLLLVSWEEPRPGFLIEHSHRLAGYLVGCCIIVLAIGLWRGESRRSVRWLGGLALVGVIMQGLLGGFRVRLNEWLGADLALLHGSFASIVFSLLISVALFTSPSWMTQPSRQQGQARSNHGSQVAACLTGLIFLQIVLGAILRHTNASVAKRGHILVAFAVVAGVAWVVKEFLDRPQRDKRVSIALALLVLLTAGQLYLGVEAWMLKYFEWSQPMTQALVRTLHVMIGHLILATSVVAALLLRQSAFAAASHFSMPAQCLEGAA